MHKFTILDIVKYYYSKYDDELYKELNSIYNFISKDWNLNINNIEEFENHLYKFISDLWEIDIHNYIDYFLDLDSNSEKYFLIIEDVIFDLLEFNKTINEELYFDIIKKLDNKFNTKKELWKIFLNYLLKSFRFKYVKNNLKLYSYIKNYILSDFSHDIYWKSYFMNELYRNFKNLSINEYNKILKLTYNKSIKELLYSRNWDFLD